MDGCGKEMLRVRGSTKPWLNLCVDTNPLHGKYDQSVQLAIAPVNFKYHAPAVNNAIDVSAQKFFHRQRVTAFRLGIQTSRVCQAESARSSCDVEVRRGEK